MSSTEQSRAARTSRAVGKCPTGVAGLDEITFGGLPRGRTTLLVGGPGCGKTLLAAEFLVRGAENFGEPGVFLAFEETAAELTENVRSLGFDLDDLIGRGRLRVDHVRVERSEIAEAGDYDLEGLFVRLGYAIDAVAAKRVVIDTLEVLFGSLADHGILRAELRRLFRWLKERGVTAIVTAERSAAGGITRHGLEEYVSDCVIVLDHRIERQVSTRRMRIVKYRGSAHGANEYPFLIGREGLVVFPITSVGLDYDVPPGYVATGVAGLDAALDGLGYRRGSSVLVSGTAGTGKTSLAASFVAAACARGQRALYLSMEEAPDQIVRNVASIGLDLGRWREAGLLQIRSTRPTAYGLETHLAVLYQAITEVDPGVVVIDPITNLGAVGSDLEVTSALTRLMDFLKARHVTALFTTLVATGENAEYSTAGVSSWMDTWVLLRTLELGQRRRRGLYVIKSRGMRHSDCIHEMQFGPGGLHVLPAVSEAT